MGIGHDGEASHRNSLCISRRSLPNPPDQPFSDFANLSATYAPAIATRIRLLWRAPRDKGHLQIDLRELRLAVLPPILVPEASRELEILVHCPGTYEQLLRLLWGLCEGIEMRLRCCFVPIRACASNAIASAISGGRRGCRRMGG